MNSRLRSLAALFALFAFSAYFAESAWASMCPPGAGAHGVPSAELSHAEMHHASAPAPDAPDAPRSEVPACPLGMTGAGGSCVAASLPTTIDPVGAAAPRITNAPLFFESTHDRLQVAAHFRPPRA